MYLNFSTLTEDPFRITPDPRYLYLSEQHARAKSFLDSTDFLTDRFVVITGEIGCGKTILLADFLSRLGTDTISVELYQLQVTPVQFLQSFLVGLGLKPFRKNKSELLTMANDALLRHHAEGKRTVLTIDEAQHLSLTVLEEIRLLAGIQKGREQILSIILAGQPGFKETLFAPEMEQLAQRAPLHFHLGALGRRETESYIRHRLGVAGDTANSIFLPETFDLIFEATGGVPRLINNLCSISMLCAFTDNQTKVTPQTTRTAVEQLQYGSAHEGESVQLSCGSCARKPIPEVEGEDPVGQGCTVEEVPTVDDNDDMIDVLQAELNEKAARVRALEEEITTLRESPPQDTARDFKQDRLEEEALVLADTISALRDKYLQLDQKIVIVESHKQVLSSELEKRQGLIEEYERKIEKLTSDRRPVPIEQNVCLNMPPLRPDIDRSICRLVSLDELRPGEYPIAVGRFAIGRSPDNDIHLENNFVSAHHAQLICGSTKSILRDLDSTNGTYVNSRSIRRHALRDGDIIKIGGRRFRYVQRTSEKLEPVTGDKGNQAGDPSDLLDVSQ